MSINNGVIYRENQDNNKIKNFIDYLVEYENITVLKFGGTSQSVLTYYMILEIIKRNQILNL